MDKTARTIEQEISPFSELPQDLKEKVLSNLNPRDMAKMWETLGGGYAIRERFIDIYYISTNLSRIAIYPPPYRDPHRFAL